MTLAKGEGWRVYEHEGQVWLDMRQDAGHYWTANSYGAAVVLTPEMIEGIQAMTVETKADAK
jgi:hypothetical protein